MTIKYQLRYHINNIIDILSSQLITINSMLNKKPNNLIKSVIEVREKLIKATNHKQWINSSDNVLPNIDMKLAKIIVWQGTIHFKGVIQGHIVTGIHTIRLNLIIRISMYIPHLITSTILVMNFLTAITILKVIVTYKLWTVILTSLNLSRREIITHIIHLRANKSLRLYTRIHMRLWDICFWSILR